MKGKIKEQWGKLTDDDLDQIADNREQLASKIQERYGIPAPAGFLFIHEAPAYMTL
ncbi:hypothetical protein ILFOPFJJ_06194 [Ensifer psoraleae]|nr:hypothetical protein [Sinorhizobium psoraleae]